MATARRRRGVPAGAAIGQQHFLPLAVRGFDDGWSGYVQAMEWFKDRLFCGTYRASLCLKLRQKTAMHHWPAYPVECPDNLLRDVDCRARIWRFDARTGSWDNVLCAPMVTGRDGDPVPREVSYRGMAVIKGKSDAEPALYVTPFSTRETAGACILRSADGEVFEPVSKPGLGLDGVASFRFLTAFRDRVYTSPVGKGYGQPNYSLYPIVFESEDPARGIWREVSPPGFGDPRNIVLFDVTAFDDHLYAGTMNIANGFELWKARPEGPAPYRWTKVLDRGAYRGQYNQAIASMCEFRGALYVGTGIQDGGFDRTNRIGPAAGEVIRVYPDDSWDLITGSPRLTPEGLQVPTSGYRPGFGNITNGYIWRMGVHDGRLYIGTMSSATFLRYASLDPWPKQVRELLEKLGVENFVSRYGGFELWSSADGDRWIPVTTDGFGNCYNMGLRTLTSTPHGLAVGTANPFGPRVAQQSGGSWEYVDNPRGGAEVWLGAADLPETVRTRAPQGSVDPGRPAESFRLPPPKPRASPSQATPPAAPRDSRRYERSKAALRRGRGRIDLAAISDDLMAEAREFYDLRVRGAENVPRRGPVLMVGNNPFVPLFVGDTLVAVHAFYTLCAISEHTGRRARLLASAAYQDASESMLYPLTTMEKLGYVPDTPGNAARLLELGEAVLAYPEVRPSRPPYQTGAFAPDHVRAARRAGAVVVPVAFAGTHESHLLIERDGRQVLVNKAQRLRAQYTITFLSPVPVAAIVEDPDDDAEVDALCRSLRQRIQIVLEEEPDQRPLLGVARELQHRYGGSADAPGSGG